MDQGKEKLKILLIHRPGEDGEGVWARVGKSLGSFTDLQTVESDSFFQGKAGEHALDTFQHIFLDYSLADWKFLENFSATPVTLLCKEPFPLEKDGARELLGERLKGRSCLSLHSLSATDLARTLHLYLIPKRVAGVVPFMEKGSVILGEKIHSPESVGISLDRLATYLDQMESFQLKERIADLRLVLAAVVLECYRLARSTTTPYPTVDFQVGVSPGKLAVNLRFQNPSLELTELAKRAMNGTDFFWHQAWLCSDLSLITEHAMHQEIEVMFLFHKPQRDPSNVFHSFLLKSLEKSGKRENLLAKPQDFTFQYLSDVRLKQHDVSQVTISQEEVSSELDLGTLPQPVIEKLGALQQALSFAQDQLAKREGDARATGERLSAIELDLQQKKGEVLRLGKANQVQAEVAARRIKDLERHIQNIQAAQKAEREAAKVTKIDTTAPDAIPKLEATLRVVEGEKVQLMEKFTSEQKRYGLLEAKYQALYKDISAKDKEINELKALAVKFKKDLEKADSGATANKAAAAPTADNAKVKEMELREQALKQELKKQMFKVENNEKNVKAIQAEAAEKAKLLEQKLQAAKAKELELLKKIDDLAALVKKTGAGKAA